MYCDEKIVNVALESQLKVPWFSKKSGNLYVWQMYIPSVFWHSWFGRGFESHAFGIVRISVRYCREFNAKINIYASIVGNIVQYEMLRWCTLCAFLSSGKWPVNITLAMLKSICSGIWLTVLYPDKMIGCHRKPVIAYVCVVLL